ncbi:hypothetical protein BS47DRAFT_840607 [Hydnum rufescens UP504]|uniref:CP-type G domain-containing protein n=1 Tax=Hydnum rufescens UP504 TaxID=1448309 RepID=A0A9P6DUZ4_9AGAM|nr:hypothetical protein BS47DRAFT_840607 [Hydnum rufescens UP504]
MPRIRKKTSNRASTNDRAKLRHKIAEGRKKNRKLAKKNPQWKSRVPKDPGIPNSMPFKDQVLAEVAAERRRAEEEKQLRKAAKKTVQQATKGDDSESEIDDSKIGMDGVTSLVVQAKTVPTTKTPKVSQPIEAAVVDEPEPLLFDPSIPDLKHALDKADVWLYVLDARDPLTHRSSFIENLGREQGKKLVFLLNKIDLSPQESLRAWLVQLRALHPTFPFRVSSALLRPVDDDAKGKTKVSETDGLGAEALVQHLEQLSSSGVSPVTIAVIGMPNSGKSAVINTICGFSRLATYKPDLLKSSTVTTTLPQPVDFDTPSGSKLRFIDTPGFDLVLPRMGDIEKYTMQAIDSLVRSRGRIEKMKLPELAAKWIVSRAKQEDLMLHYSTPAYLASDPLSFLSGHARTTGRLKKGGVLDITDSARSILRDWRVGKFPYYTSPPGPANVEGLSAEDEKVLGNVRSRKEMRAHPGLIRLSSGTVDSRSVTWMRRCQHQHEM